MSRIASRLTVLLICLSTPVCALGHAAVITSISPISGQPATQVTIVGARFGSNPGKVTFNGALAKIVSWSPNGNQVVVRAPNGTTGSGPVVVNGQSNSVNFSFTPTILSIAPQGISVGQTATAVGLNFGSTTGIVTVSGQSAKILSWKPNTISFTVPNVSTGANPATVTNSVGSSPTIALNVQFAPSITSIAPTSGQPFTQVTITGAGFGTNLPGRVTFNGAPAHIVSWANSKIVVNAPDGLGGSGPVVVSLHGLKSNGVAFSFLPTIVALVPSTVKAGFKLGIVGENFLSFPGSVMLNGAKLTTSYWSNFLIVLAVPSTARTGPIVVTTSAGASNSKTLTVQGGAAPLTIAAMASPPPNANGWNNTNVTVTFMCNGGVAPVQCPTTQTIATEGANQIITGTAKDASGVTASTSVVLNIDRTAPVITASVSPAPNANGWINTTATVTFICTDSLSGIASCPSPLTIAQGANQVITEIATDKAGNSASTSVTLNVSSTFPTITATASPPPNANGWNNTNVTVKFTCAPSIAPIASCPPSQTITGEVANLSVPGVVMDAAGNTGNTSVTVSLDKTSPVVTIASPANGSTIALGAASVGINGADSDSVSGVTSVSCNGTPAAISSSTFTCTVTLTAGSNSISVQATDLAGNTGSSPLSLTYAPAPQITIASPANLSVTNLSPVTVNGTVSDPTSTLTINGISVPQSGTFSTPVPLVEGLNVLSTVATNASGISSTATVQITLDTTPPHITIDSPAGGTTTTALAVSVTGSANDIVVGTVNSQDVQVTVNGTAAQVANRSYSVANVPLALGLNTIQAAGVDRAGNGTTTSITVTRSLPSQPPQPAVGQAVMTQWLNIVSGNNQSGVVGTHLSAPVVVSLTDGTNQPIPNQTIVFKVTGSNGLVSTVSSGTPASALVASTDANGQAKVLWTLGQRAGAGINSLQASSALAVSPANFSATGLTANAAQIVVDSGNNQIGVLGQQLPFPFVADVVDSGFNRVPDVPVTFTVKHGDATFGGTSATQTVNTDSNGRAIAVLTLGFQDGINNEVVEATFQGNPGFPAAFVASAKAPGNPANTTISGVVLNNSNNPIPGTTIRLFQANQGSSNNLPVQIGTPVQAGAQGTFLITNAPVGSFKLMADGSTATGAATYPTLEYDIVTVAGTDNTVGMPIYLPTLDTTNQLCVDATHGGTLTLPQAPGFALTVLPGSATFPGGSKQGCVTVTPVNGDKVPMSPGFGQQPRFIVTIQPVGTTFNPPAPITLPNVDGLPAKSVTEMYSYDHDLGMFIAIGTGTVSDDGSAIVSNPGVGVLKAGWHCGGNPNSTGSAGTCPECQVCQGSACGNSAPGSDPLDPQNSCCFQGQRLNKFGESPGLTGTGPLVTQCPGRVQINNYQSDGCTSPASQNPMFDLYGTNLLNVQGNPNALAFGQDLGQLPSRNAAGPLACNQHDACYQDCTTDDPFSAQSSCDAAFYQRMSDVCDAGYPSTCPANYTLAQCVGYFTQRVSCIGFASAYFNAVDTYAVYVIAFKPDQEQHCKCCQ